MKDFFGRLRVRLQRALIGRNGLDSLARVMYFLGLGLLILQWIVPRRALYYLGLLFLGYSLFRVFSRNLSARQRENAAFLRATDGIRSRLRLTKRKWRDRKTHRYFTCPNCRQTVRIPKTLGKVKIHCPNCGHSFIARM